MNGNNQTPSNWEDFADKNQGGEKKARKPLKLSSGAQAFNPGQAGFVPGGNSFQPYNQYQGGYQQGGFQQGGYQQGDFQQGGFQQGGFQQGGYQGGQQQQQKLAPYDPTHQKTDQQRPPTQGGQAQTQAKPTTTTTTTQQTKAPAPTTTTTQQKPKPAETKKVPEPKVEAKKETKKGGKVDKKTASEKKKEESKEAGGVPERSYTKLQNLLNAQKNMKADKVDLEAALKEKAKYDEVPDESRLPVNIVFIGHVDAGKSTTCGNILLLTGQVDQADVRKLKQEAKEKNRESWWIAYLMDIGEEEKTKGKTVEVGKARFNTKSKRFTILDAPGHKNYVPNMIAGASQADVACLVVSAKTGEFESGFEKTGQTCEHAMLAKSLGVQDIIILINKMDEQTIDWDQKRYDYIKKNLQPFLRDSCGYEDKNVHWIPYSAINGDNMQEMSKNPKSTWYKGPTFFDLLDQLPAPARDSESPVRIPVLDKFKDGGSLYVFGKVESGTIVHSSKLTLVPSGDVITIYAIYDDADKRIPYAKPGEGVKLHIKGIEDDYVNRGDMICSNHSFPFVCNEFEAEIQVTDLPEHKAIMSTGYTCVIHLHAAMEEVYIREVKSEYSKTEEKYKPAKYLKAGSTGIVIVATKSPHPICCEKAETMPHLGRFTLRDEGKTIGSGKIMRVKPVAKAQ